MGTVVRNLSAEGREAWLRSWENLWKFNLLQPEQAKGGGGADVRRREWRRWAGGKSGGAKWLYIGAGALLGFAAGLVFGLAVPPVPAVEELNASMILALLVAPLGGYGGHIMSRSGSFYDGMILVIVNERRSKIRKSMVTAQSRICVPKTLVAWRSQDWRYTNGRPYLWLRLPYGMRIHQALSGTMSYLGLEDDFYRARDAAVYAQRAWNRMIAQNGDDYAVLDEPEPEPNKIAEFGPWIGAAVILVGGILMFLLSLE